MRKIAAGLIIGLAAVMAAALCGCGSDSFTLGGKKFDYSVEEIKLSDTSISSLAVLKKCESLTTISLNNCDIKNINDLGDIETLRRVTLNDNKISDISPLKNLTQLDVLSVSGNNNLRPQLRRYA